MQTFGNITLRTSTEQRRHERDEWAATGVQPRICVKCAWLSDPAGMTCPKCGVIFAKARSTEPSLPLTSTPLPRDDAFEPLADEARDDAPYYFGELRVMSMLSSVATLAFIVAAQKTGNEPLAIAFVLQLAALMTWIGARAFDWGIRNGTMGFLVLFFVTGWLWPALAKPLAWIARMTAAVLPRATSWMVTGVLVVLSCAAAATR